MAEIGLVREWLALNRLEGDEVFEKEGALLGKVAIISFLMFNYYNF